MNNIIDNISTNTLRRISLTDDIINADDTMTVLDNLDKRLSDITVDGESLQDIINTLYDIIIRFGDEDLRDVSKVTVTITQDDIDNGNNVVKLLQHPMLKSNKSTYTIDWGD